MRNPEFAMLLILQELLVVLLFRIHLRFLCFGEEILN